LDLNVQAKIVEFCIVPNESDHNIWLLVNLIEFVPNVMRVDGGEN
jgi:hypothetical protein